MTHPLKLVTPEPETVEYVGWHLHRWCRWEDVKLGERTGPVPMTALVFVVRQVITQQRRCSVCNMVQSRYSA